MLKVFFISLLISAPVHAGGNTGRVFPTTCVNQAGIGSFSWTNPSNATSDNGSFATTALFTPPDTSNYLHCSGFSISSLIPSGAIIRGIEVIIDKGNSGTGNVTDQEMFIVVNGSSSPVRSGSIWSSGFPINSYYGGRNDLWSLNPTKTTLDTISVKVACIIDGLGPSNSAVDFMAVTVYFGYEEMWNWDELF